MTEIRRSSDIFLELLNRGWVRHCGKHLDISHLSHPEKRGVIHETWLMKHLCTDADHAEDMAVSLNLSPREADELKPLKPCRFLDMIAKGQPMTITRKSPDDISPAWGNIQDGPHDALGHLIDMCINDKEVVISAIDNARAQLTTERNAFKELQEQLADLEARKCEECKHYRFWAATYCSRILAYRKTEDFCCSEFTPRPPTRPTPPDAPEQTSPTEDQD